MYSACAIVLSVFRKTNPQTISYPETIDFMKRIAVHALSLLLAPASALSAQPTAFPGAYGFGANATGGRAGTIYHVTNLNDSGPGSFRDAVSAGNRIVVFDVGGYIVLQSPVPVSSNISIEGQTAPGGGIGIMAGEVSLSGKTNIIMRNVRMRQGNLDPLTGKSALNMGTGNNIILDHCSFEYGQWDSVDAVKTTNFTVQNSIIADPIYQQFGAHVETGPSTFYRNLWVNVHNRQPLAKNNTIYVNNIVYDYQDGYTTGNTGGFFSHDLINNYFITGPATTTASNDWFQMDANQSVYPVGNYLDSSPDGVLNGVLNNMIGTAGTYLSAPWSPVTSTIPALDAPTAYTSVLASAGALPRDQVDTQVVGDAASLGTRGQLYKDQAVTGIPNEGYGTIAAGSQFPEASNSGIPDYWALANGISTTDPNAGTVSYGNTGYTSLEAYANSVVLPDAWSAKDLPGTPIQGQSSFNPFTGQWLLAGSGDNDYSAVSVGQFAAKPWTQDGSFTAKVNGLSGDGPQAKGGILFTSTGNGGTAYVSLQSTANGDILFLWQAAGGQAMSTRLHRVGFPIWLRLTSGAGTFTASYSLGGANYTTVAMTALSLPGAVQAGLLFSPGDASLLGTGTFSNVSITPTN